MPSDSRGAGSKFESGGHNFWRKALKIIYCAPNFVQCPQLEGALCSAHHGWHTKMCTHLVFAKELLYSRQYTRRNFTRGR